MTLMLPCSAVRNTLATAGGDPCGSMSGLQRGMKQVMLDRRVETGCTQGVAENVAREGQGWRMAHVQVNLASGMSAIPDVELRVRAEANKESREGMSGGMNEERKAGEHAFGSAEGGGDVPSTPATAGDERAQRQEPEPVEVPVQAGLAAADALAEEPVTDVRRSERVAESGEVLGADEGAKISVFDRVELGLARLRASSEAFEARLDAAPLTRPCAAVPGHGEAVLNREASFAAAREVYTCPVCTDVSPQGRLQRRMEAVGIPSDVRHATLENFATERPETAKGEGLMSPAGFLARARLFAEDGVRNLLLAGPPGIGKGHLAAALAVRELALGHSVCWTDCSRLFKDLHRSYDDGSTERLVRRHAEVSLLVLDELCMRDLPADGEEILFAILDARHKSARRTILLGNRPARATREWLGCRLLDRLRSGGIAFCYGEWQSMRGTPGDGAM